LRRGFVIVDGGGIGEEVAHLGVAIDLDLDALSGGRALPLRDGVVGRESIADGDMERCSSPGRDVVGNDGVPVNENYGRRRRPVAPEFGNHSGAHRDAGQHGVLGEIAHGVSRAVPDRIPSDYVHQRETLFEGVDSPAVVEVGNQDVMAVGVERGRDTAKSARSRGRPPTLRARAPASSP